MTIYISNDTFNHMFIALFRRLIITSTLLLAYIFKIHRQMGQYGPPKRCYTNTTLHSVTTQTTST